MTSIRGGSRRRALCRLVGSCAAVWLAACGGRDAGDPEGREQPKVLFRDVAEEAGVDAVTVCGNLDKRHLLESTGTGVAVADYDGDGDEDLYVPTAQTTDDWLAGRRPRANALYRNNGDGTFTDVAEEAGVALRAWSAGAYFADTDNDGDFDLFVTAWGPNVLYRNNGDGTFTDVTRRAGLAGDPGDWSTSAAFGDLDGDGDLDLYVANYCVYDLRNPPFGGARSLWKGIEVYPGPRGFTGQPDRVYRNDGDGTFTEVTAEALPGNLDNPHYGLGVVFSDLDDDGDPDIYVANDSVPDYLWRNDGGFRFQEIGAFANVSTNEDGKEQAGMGTDAGDYDNDGDMDLFVTNFSHEWNTLHRNESGLRFTDATFEVGMRDSFLDLVWATKFFDFDHDGWLDLFTANGHIYPEVDRHPHLNTRYRQRNRLYRNESGKRFINVTAEAGPGFEILESSRGGAVADLDRDGDLDLVITNLDARPNVLLNEGGQRRPWIALGLRGTASNRYGVGARITVTTPGLRQVREVNPFGSYESQSTYWVHVGLGSGEAPVDVEVRWPSGRTDRFPGLEPRRFVRLEEGGRVLGADPPSGWRRP